MTHKFISDPPEKHGPGMYAHETFLKVLDEDGKELYVGRNYGWNKDTKTYAVLDRNGMSIDDVPYDRVEPPE